MGLSDRRKEREKTITEYNAEKDKKHARKLKERKTKMAKFYGGIDPQAEDVPTKQKDGKRAVNDDKGMTEDPEPVEVVENAGKPSIEEIKRRIDDAIEEYKEICIQYKTYDPNKPFNTFLWANTCHFIGMKVFKDKQLLQIDRCINGGTPEFDIDRFNAIYDYYILLTEVHNSAPRIYDFARFISVNQQVLYDGASLGRGEYAKKIMRDSEGGFASMLTSGRGNVTGVAMVLNVKHGWTQSKEIVHTDAQSRLTVQELPRLGAMGGGGNNIGVSE